MSKLRGREKRKKLLLNPFPEFAAENAQQRSPGASGSSCESWGLRLPRPSPGLPAACPHPRGAKPALPGVSAPTPAVSSTYLGIPCMYLLPEAEFCLDYIFIISSLNPKNKC